MRSDFDNSRFPLQQEATGFHTYGQMVGPSGDLAPDRYTQGGAIMHYKDPLSGEWQRCTVEAYAAAGNHFYTPDAQSVWTGPWVTQTFG